MEFSEDNRLTSQRQFAPKCSVLVSRPLFSCLFLLAPSVTRVAFCVSRVLLDGLQKKERLLVVYRKTRKMGQIYI